MSGPRAYTARAIVLRARNLGEADKIVTLLTVERGKVDAVAKGIRRAKSHFAGRLEFANECALSLHRGRNLDIIVSADIVNAHWLRLVEPSAFGAASIAAELVDAFCEIDLAVPEVYELLRMAIAAIAASEEPMSLIPRFEIRLLDALGLAPPIDVCARCANPLEGSAWLDLDAGGFSGEECRERWQEMLTLDADDMHNVRALAARRGDATAAVRARSRVSEAIERLVHHHLGRRTKAGAPASEFVGKRS